MFPDVFQKSSGTFSQDVLIYMLSCYNLPLPDLTKQKDLLHTFCLLQVDYNRHLQPPWGVSYPLLYPHLRQPLPQLLLHLLHLHYRPHFNPLQLLLCQHHRQHQLLSEPAQQAVRSPQHCQVCQLLVSQQLQQQAQACRLPLELLLGLVKQ